MHETVKTEAGVMTYMRPSKNTPLRPSLALVFIFKDQMVGRGSVKIRTSVMTLKAPMAMNDVIWLPHVASRPGV